MIIVVIRPTDMEQNRRLNFCNNDVVVFAREELTINLAFTGQLLEQQNQKFNDLNADNNDTIDAMKKEIKWECNRFTTVYGTVLCLIFASISKSTFASKE